MTMPPEDIQVVCPDCGHQYQDWIRSSINLTLDDFSDAYLREASTAKCPKCGKVVELYTLIVDRDGVWRTSA